MQRLRVLAQHVGVSGPALTSPLRLMTTAASSAAAKPAVSEDDMERIGYEIERDAKRAYDADASGSILIKTNVNTRVVVLNRPKALNALNLDMVRYLTPKYKAWNFAEATPITVLVGAGTKAFCAGGDVVSLVQAIDAKTNLDITRAFFAEEYQLNYLIGTLSTPHIALLDGITMGGGVGLSVHGMFRVATEHTVFAMPETGIGFFPDVGGSYFLSRLPGELGMFLGLTGHRLTGIDLLYAQCHLMAHLTPCRASGWYARIATHFVPSKRLKLLVENLASLSTISRETVDNLLKAHEATLPDAYPLAGYRAIIDRCFSADSVEEILTRLRNDGTSFALQQVAALDQMSPTSLKVTYRQIREGKRLSLADCLRMEYRLSQRFMAGHDFVEGVHARVMDKPRRHPRWSPVKLSEVTDAEVDKYFEPLPADQELQLVDHSNRPVA